MDLLSFLAGSVSVTVLLGVAGFLFKAWVEKRIEYSVKHEYDKLLLKHEEEREVRLRAALVAELMAEWLKEDKVDFDLLNKLSFEAFLWLPTDLAVDLSDTLAHKPGADDVRVIIQKVRRHLLGNEDTLDANHVIIFRNKKPNKPLAPTR